MLVVQNLQGKLTIERGVRLRGIHSEGISILRAQVSGGSSVINLLARVVDEESVSRREQRNGGRALIFSSIPDHASSGFDTHVGGQCIFLLVHAARGHHINRRWSNRERSVVPFEGHLLANLVIARGQGIRGDHGHASSGGGWVNGDRRGRGRLGLGLGSASVRASVCASCL